MEIETELEVTTLGRIVTLVEKMPEDKKKTCCGAFA